MIARLAASFLAAWALLPALTAAQGYPSKPVLPLEPTTTWAIKLASSAV